MGWEEDVPVEQAAPKTAEAAPWATDPEVDQYSAEEYEPPRKKEKRSFLGHMGELAGSGALAVGEAGLTAATGMGAAIAAGLRGMGSIISGEGPEEAARKVRETEERYTYAPRTRMGQTATRAMAMPFELASAAGGKIGGAIGGVVGGEQGRIAGESIGEAVPQMALAAAPLKGVIKAGKKPVEELPPATPKEHQAKRAQELGYVLPPSEANPSLLNRFITGWGGKIQTEQAASIKNQPVTNRLAKKALGVAEDKTLSTELLENVRANAGKSYRAIKETNIPIRTNPKYEKALDDLSQDWSIAEKDYPELAKSKSDINDLKQMLKKESVTPTGAIEMVKDLRASAKDNFRVFSDPQKVALGRAQRNAADALDTLIEDNLKEAGKPELVSEYKKSRELIAKSYDVEASLNEATGNVNAVYLGKLLKKRPLRGELRDIARFARTFEKSARTPEAVGTYPGISPLDVGVAGMEAVPALVGGRPGLAAAAIGGALARPVARTAGLSEYYQKRGASATRKDTGERGAAAMRRGAPAGAVGAAEAEEEDRRKNQIRMEEGF